MNLREQAAELLERGAEIINERGWIVGEAENQYGVCAYGALAVASREQNLSWQQHMSIVNVIDNEMQLYFHDTGFVYDEKPLVQYNDEEAEEAGQVIDVLKHVAKNIRNTLTPEGESSASTP